MQVFIEGLLMIFPRSHKLLCQPLQHDMLYLFSEECEHAFKTLKKALIFAPIMKARDWTKPFELICDASDFAI